MNKIILMGRLTKAPEVKYTQTGKVVTSFTLAVNRPFTGQDGQREADFINCQIWGKAAETLGNTVGKGHRIAVEGRLQIRNYEAKDGSKRWITEVICDRFEYVETRAEAQNGAQEAASQAQGTPTAQNTHSTAQPTAPMGGSMESFGSSVPFDEEIPF